MSLGRREDHNWSLLEKANINNSFFEIGKPRETIKFLSNLSYYTAMCCLMTGIHSEKCIVR